MGKSRLLAHVHACFMYLVTKNFVVYFCPFAGNGVRNYSSHSPMLFIQVGFHLVMDWVLSDVPNVQV